MCHYYLGASLPPLQWREKPPLAGEDFLSRCADQLLPNEYDILTETELLPHGQLAQKLPALRHYYAWDGCLRHELARLRAAELGRKRPEDLPGPTPDRALSAFVFEVFQLEEPLQAERKLDRERWTCLDHLEPGHYFDLEWLGIYRLKLQLLERHARFHEGKGETKLDQLLSQMEERSDQAMRAADHLTGREAP